jgi:hypothetical protein
MKAIFVKKVHQNPNDVDECTFGESLFDVLEIFGGYRHRR